MIPIDIGNSRCKWLQGDELCHGATVGELVDALPEGAELRVAATRPGAIAALRRQASRRSLRVTAVGEELALPDLGQHEGCGSDRVLAGLGWAAMAPEQAVVLVSCGTAVTVDAWWPGPRHGGGLIAPGLAVCRAGLAQATPALPSVAPDWRAGLGQDTASGLGIGLAVGWRGLALACIERVQAVSGIDRLVLTGGDAAILRRYWPENAVPDLHPELVLKGLLVL